MRSSIYRTALLWSMIGALCLASCGSTQETKVDVGGFQLFLHCTGSGSPTIVMDSGLAADSTAWLPVLPDLARLTRVCVYDRASLGASDRGPQPTDSQQIVQQLHALLTNAQIPSPYVLVGWSYGSWNVLLYTSQYRHDVVGVLLLDPPHPEQDKQFLALAPSAAADTSAQWQGLRANWLRGEPAPANNPEGVRWQQSASELRAVKPLGPLPLVIITAGHSDWLPQATPDIMQKFDRARQDMQQDFVRLSSRSKQMLAPESGHCIQCYQPRLVIDAVGELVAMARNS